MFRFKEHIYMVRFRELKYVVRSRELKYMVRFRKQRIWLGLKTNLLSYLCIYILRN